MPDMPDVAAPYTRATQGQTIFHASRRVGGQVVDKRAWVLVKVAAS
jgi:HK97 family phage major capsid protein